MWVGKHSGFCASVVRRALLLVDGKVNGGCGWTISLKKDQTQETEEEKEREAQNEAHAQRFSSRITIGLHWACK